LILACIVCNTLLLLIQYYKQDENESYVLEIINLVFTAIFILEAIVKIVGLGKEYFKSVWNIFDFIVVLFSIVGMFVTYLGILNVGGKTTIIRAMRICRVLRLIKRAKRLYVVFHTIASTLPGMGNICLLLGFLIYIYAVVGVQIFSNIKRNGALTDQFGFHSFPIAFLSLIALATGDPSPGIMYSIMRQNRIDYQCMVDPTYQDYVDNDCKS
jgi:hypothetical protein